MKRAGACLLLAAFASMQVAAQSAPTRRPSMVETVFPDRRGTSATGESAFAVGASVEQTDNTNRSAVDAASDTVLGAIAGFRYVRPADSRFSADIDGTATYYRYTQDSYPDELLANVHGKVGYEFMPDHLSWVAEDVFSPLRVDELAADSPNNRQNFNLAMTGFNYQNLFGERTAALVSAHYERADYEVSNADSHAVVLRASLGRLVSDHQSLRISVSGRQIRYASESDFPDYDGQDYSLTWIASGAYTDLSIEGGYSNVSFPTEDENEPLLRVNLQRQMSNRTFLTLTASHELTGSSDAIHFDQTYGGHGPRTSEVAVNPDPFVLEYLGLNFEFTGNRLYATFNASTGTDRYVVSTTDDRDHVSAALQLLWQFSPNWSMGFDYSYEDEDFVQRAEARSKFRDATAYAAVFLGARTQVQLSFGRSQRDTTFAGGAYVENVGRVVLLYMPGTRPARGSFEFPRSRR
jgi:hypothetical protein